MVVKKRDAIKRGVMNSEYFTDKKKTVFFGLTVSGLLLLAISPLFGWVVLKNHTVDYESPFGL